ncbi:MAG: phosphoglucomutase/phosphomannomutase family protein [Clostridia bacterium]|nr:phosphoglucomutase/phosphomannomutase family protein [Clostridia bacterium]
MSLAETLGIRFGTDGWRDVIADRYTFANVRRVAQALCDVLAAEGGPRSIVVGHDTRFLSDRFALAVARVASANGFDAFLTQLATPTPAVAWATRERGAAAGVMITASHNPPIYNGFKIKGPFGGPALPDFTAAVERRLAENVAAGREPREDDARVRQFDALPTYLDQVRRLVQFDVVARARGPWISDAMHGAGRGILAGLLREAGVDVVEIRGDVNPSFGGVNPEPVAANLEALRQAVVSHGARGGVVTDGDADRVGAVDEHGRIVDSQRIFALLLQHLVEDRGWRGTVVKTFAVTDMVDKLARRYGLEVLLRPVGFKYVTEYALTGNLLLGGEESGGLGIQHHLPERDGIVCALLLIEMCGARGKTLGELVDDLMQTVGYHVYRRLDLHLTEEQKRRLMERLRTSPPRSVAGLAVTGIDPLDGYKLRLGDRGWILFRASGTEPIVRVYAELDDDDALERVLEAGRTLAERGD